MGVSNIFAAIMSDPQLKTKFNDAMTSYSNVRTFFLLYLTALERCSLYFGCLWLAKVWHQRLSRCRWRPWTLGLFHRKEHNLYYRLCLWTRRYHSKHGCLFGQTIGSWGQSSLRSWRLFHWQRLAICRCLHYETCFTWLERRRCNLVFFSISIYMIVY